VLLIGRRFWPHVSIDTGGQLFQFACALQRQGVSVDVLTPRYSTSWPTEFTIREILVHRPVMAPKRDWSMGRYTRSLTTWLRQRSANYDVMFCDSIREESVAAIEASRSTGRPVIVRSSRWGSDSDPQWWTTGRSARRCGSIAKMADAVIVKNAECQRLLLADGYSAPRLHRIDPGFAAGPVRSSTARLRARVSLGSANSDLIAEHDSTVLVCPSNMSRENGVNQLVLAARHLVARFPKLKLWFLGDGPNRDWIYDTLRSDGIRASIAMPGSFCDVEDILTAADVYFQPDESGLEFWLPSAIAAEVPVVAIDSEAIRALIGDHASARSNSRLNRQVEESRGDGLAGDGDSDSEFVPQRWVHWCSPDHRGLLTPKSVRLAIRKVLDEMEQAADRAALLRRYLLRNRPQAAAVEAYLALFESVVGTKSSGSRNESIEART
jgi:glycosyltransferase involved in cell wall biosynthesis